MKLAMQAPMPARRGANAQLRTPGCASKKSGTASRRAAASGSPPRPAPTCARRRRRRSLQLALENKKLADRAPGLCGRAQGGRRSKDDDIVGYVFAVNGKLNSAEVYESNGLFRKMWPKLLDASATEAIGHRDDPKAAAAGAQGGDGVPRRARRRARRAKRRSISACAGSRARDDKELLFETSLADGWVHRSYLAK